MRYKKGWRFLFPFILTGMITLSGCADEEAPGGVTDVSGALFLSENAGEDEADSSADDTVSEITGAETDPGLTPQARELSEEECASMEEFINDPGCYGFLLSVYERPQDLDAEQVFFVGAGLEIDRVSDEEREAYLEETQTEEAVNLFKLSASQVSDYLLYRAGISYNELTEKPDWVYLGEYDSYYQCHGDEETNVCTFEVTDGAVQGDYYRVHYKLKRNAVEEDGWHIPCYEAILKKNGDSYRFCANRLWMEKELLARTFFRTDLHPGGYSAICAYSPEKNVSENADVTFAIVQNGDVKYILPGMEKTNIRRNLSFNNVRAVDCGDYDGDGRTEILTICRYQLGRGGKAREDSLEARIYRLNETGEPSLDSTMTRAINSKLKVLSISAIESYIKTGKTRPVYNSWKEAYTAEISELDPEDFSSFALIYIDDNRVPELLEMGNSAAKGARIVVYHDGVMEETKVNRSFSFLRKENLLYCKNGTGNMFSETLYIITGNRLGIFQNGNYGSKDSAVTAYRKDGKPVYSYYWEGSEVSEAGYRDALNFIFDVSRAFGPDKLKMMSREEILKELK